MTNHDSDLYLEQEDCDRQSAKDWMLDDRRLFKAANFFFTENGIPVVNEGEESPSDPLKIYVKLTSWEQGCEVISFVFMSGVSESLREVGQFASEYLNPAGRVNMYANEYDNIQDFNNVLQWHLNRTKQRLCHWSRKDLSEVNPHLAP